MAYFVLTVELSPPLVSKVISVLVVEDDTIIHMDGVDMLVSAGFEVFEAANAVQATKLLERRSNIDLIFTDVSMPGTMNGLALGSCAGSMAAHQDHCDLRPCKGAAW